MDARIQNNLAFRIPEVRNGYGIPLNFSKFYDSQNIRVQNIVSGSSHGTLPKFSSFLIGSHGACTTLVSGWLGHMIHVTIECTRHAAAPGLERQNRRRADELVTVGFSANKYHIQLYS